MICALWLAACGAKDDGHRDGGASQDASAAVDLAVADAHGDSDAATRYSGSLDYVVCDLKQPLAGTAGMETSSNYITTANYGAVLDGFVNGMGCNAIRVYIDSTISDPTTYPALYTTVLNHARVDLGLKVYANPLDTGTFGKTPDEYTAWIVAYANALQPDFIGPFNEPGSMPFDEPTLETIAQSVRAGLTYPAKVVGPDVQKLESTLALLQSSSTLAGRFDVLGSHNAVDDNGATSAAWTMLAQTAGRPAWSSENPRAWSDLVPDAGEVGISAVVASPIAGLVIYEAYPSCVNADGTLTTKGAGIAAGILR